MIKFVETAVTFSEVPDEITLCINISNCPYKCKGCHSSYLAEDIGTILTKDILYDLIDKNKGISCVSFMGGNYEEIKNFALDIRTKYKDNIKIAWYTGQSELPSRLYFFDYIKIGPYMEEFGPLDNPNTNQRFYKIDNDKAIDITNKFWKRYD
jgi:anaerobic ribonucleoside-triphosphate reductase activating protein